MENKMSEVAKLLGVELGEKFDILGKSFSPYTLTNEGFFDKSGDCESYEAVILHDLLLGKLEIIRPLLTKDEKEDYEIDLEEENMEKYTQENIKKAYDTLCNEAGTTPVHYNTKIQPVEFMESNFSFEQMQGAYKFNIIKYISRYEKKDGLKDLRKAKDYLEMLIKLEEGENGND